MEFFGGVAELHAEAVQRLEHPHFRMIRAIVRHPRTDVELLVVDRLTTGERPETDVLAIFQRDHEGPVGDLGAEHLSADGTRFATAFTAIYESDSEERIEVTYRLLDGEEFHGVRDSQADGRLLSQALYGTEDDEDFNLALVEWEGEWLAAWFGKELRKDHVSVL